MSSRDPLGLFPASQPAPTQAATTSGGGGGLSWAIVGVLFGIALLLGYQRFGGDFSHGDDGGGGDKHEHVQPGKVEGYLIFIHERQTLSADEADMVDVAEDFASVTSGLEVRSVDDEDDSPGVVAAIDFAKTKGVVPPCLVHKGKQAGDFRNAVAFPHSLDELKKVFK